MSALIPMTPTDELFVDVGSGPLPFLGAIHASRAYRDTIEKMGVGASRTPACRIVNTRGEVVGRISYNGKVWEGAEYVEGAAPVYNPYETREELGARYKSTVGYDPFEDDPQIGEDEVRQTLRELAEEIAA